MVEPTYDELKARVAELERQFCKLRNEITPNIPIIGCTCGNFFGIHRSAQKEMCDTERDHAQHPDNWLHVRQELWIHRCAQKQMCVGGNSACRCGETPLQH